MAYYCSLDSQTHSVFFFFFLQTEVDPFLFKPIYNGIRPN